MICVEYYLISTQTYGIKIIKESILISLSNERKYALSPSLSILLFSLAQ